VTGAVDRQSGRVLLLIGASSVGKTTLAQALQRSLNGLWLIAGVDTFWGMLEEETLPAGEFRTDSEAMARITRGWHRAVAALAREGNDVLVDELPIHRWWLDDWREVLEGLRWSSVLLTARLPTLTARESQRGDRPSGLAASDLVTVPTHEGFDLVIDTDDKTVDDCVAAIRSHIDAMTRR
jgi:chloramphenicol 3-O phosphotransferase